MPLRVAVSSLFIFPFLLLFCSLFFVTFSLEYLFHQQHLNQYVFFLQKYLVDGRFDLKDVTRCFEKTPQNRLDQKDEVSIYFSFFHPHVLFLFIVNFAFFSPPVFFLLTVIWLRFSFLLGQTLGLFPYSREVP
jgi:hypothetical protein